MKELELSLERYLASYSPAVKVRSPAYVAHLARYEFAISLLRGDECVLDVGCGEGLGAAFLAGRAAHVVAVDIHPEVIEHARRRYRLPNLEFRTGDAMRPPFHDSTFDIVCAFEIIEHVEDDRAFLREIRRILRHSGVLILSTPNRLVSEVQHGRIYPFHRREYYYSELRNLMESEFDRFEIFGQTPFVADHLRRRLYKFRDLGRPRGLGGKILRVLDRVLRHSALASLERDLPDALKKFDPSRVDVSYTFLVQASKGATRQEQTRSR